MAGKIWVDQEGNRYSRHFESKVSTNKLSGTHIGVFAIRDIEGISWDAVCLDHGQCMSFETLTSALHHSTVPEWCAYCHHKIWNECGPDCNDLHYYPYEECKLDETSGDDPSLDARWLYHGWNLEIGTRYRFELIEDEVLI